MRDGSDCPAFVIPNYDAGTRVGHQGDTRNDSDCLTSKKPNPAQRSRRQENSTETFDSLKYMTR